MSRYDIIRVGVTVKAACIRALLAITVQVYLYTVTPFVTELHLVHTQATPHGTVLALGYK